MHSFYIQHRLSVGGYIYIIIIVNDVTNVTKKYKIQKIVNLKQGNVAASCADAFP